MEEEQVW